MIWRRPKPKVGDKRFVEKFALFPRSFDYDGEEVTVWLESFVREEMYGRSPQGVQGWYWQRNLTVAGACLEKLNSPAPEPVNAQPVGSYAGVSWLQNMLSRQQHASMLGQAMQQQQALRPGQIYQVSP